MKAGTRNPEEAADGTNQDSREPFGNGQDIIVTGGLDDVVKVWHFEDDELRLKHTMTGHSLGIVSVAISSDGQSRFHGFCMSYRTCTNVHMVSAIASSSLDSSLCFWKTETGQLLNQVAFGPVDLWSVTFSPCDKYVVSGSQEGKITMYNVETGKQERVLDPQNGKFTLSIAYVGSLTSFRFLT